MPTYAELRLRIDRGVAQGSYRIVATGPAGEALGRFKLPFADIELENFILKIGSTRRGRRRIDSPEMELAKTFGTKLFGALFEGDVRELYRSSIAESRADGRGLRVTLSLTGAPELLQVPWEYLYDHPSFLSISTWTPIVRYLDLPKPRRPLQIDLPLRILGLVSAPSDFEAIDAAQERAKLEAALAPLIEAGAIAIDWLEEASLRALQRQLRKADYHVFHYIGHGGYDNDADDGVLLFEDEHGRGQRVSGVQLGRMLADEVSLRLAVLNSCEGGRSSLQDPFSGVATSLIEFEIPAVIGMQFEITDRAAIVFGGEFYSALADGLAVDAAVAEARKAIYADQNDVEWGTPVLFMRVADGKLFDVKAHAPVRPSVEAVPPEPEASPVAGEEVERADIASAAALAAAAAETERKRLADAGAAAEAERLERERVEQERVQREAEEAEAAADAERRRAADADAQVEAERLERERVEQERVQREAEEAEAAADAERRRAADADAQVEAERLEREQADLEAAAAAARAAASEAEQAKPDGLHGTSRDEPVVTAAVTGATGAGLVGGPAPAIVADAEVAPAPAVAPPRLARTAMRALIGAPITVFLGWVAYYAAPDVHLPDDLGTVVGPFLGEVVAVTTVMVLAVCVAEYLWPATRVPDGRAYRLVGGNRWLAAALQGAVIAGTAGFATSMVYDAFYDNTTLLTFEVAALTAVFGAIAFVIAEAILDRLPGDRSSASDNADRPHV